LKPNVGILFSDEARVALRTPYDGDYRQLKTEEAQKGSEKTDDDGIVHG
jgi:hypothetical protein